MDVVSVLKNKVVVYLASRYITYAIQFITSLLIAAELGPYYMGIWGFILLLLQYFQQFHFGIANSFNVLYVHHRDNEQECNNYIGNSLMLVCYLALLVVCFYLYYVFIGFSGFEKYHADKYVIWICLIAVLQYFVQFFVNLLRVKNQLNMVGFCQSIIVVLNFVCILLFQGEALIQGLIASYIIGNMLCILLVLGSGSVPVYSKMEISVSCQKEILKKGLYLFLYNSCFYFIIISIRTIISSNYTIEEFGMFTFSFTLAHAVLLVLETFSFIVYPKIIDKLSSNNTEIVFKNIKLFRSIFITSAHALIYVALVCFPILLFFFPKYEGALTSLNLIALAILLNYNSCGYLELFIARNHEKPRNGVQVKTVCEPKFLGTIGSIKFVEKFYNDTVLVMNSDLFTNIDYEDFFLHFQQHDAEMSVAAVPYNVSIPYGILDLDGRNIQGLLEKPQYNHYANAGIYLIKRRALDEIPEDTFFNATDLVEKLIAEGKKVIRYPLNGTWIDIGNPQEYQKAKDLVKHI